jgi:RHS repeat-associated protein
MARISNKALTGVSENKFKYNGKEEQRKEMSDGSGLEWLDYGARMYDAQTARWVLIDPLSEKFYFLTPFTFTDNNPVNNLDPNGRDIIYGVNSIKFTGSDAIEFYNSLRQSQAPGNSKDDDEGKKINNDKPLFNQFVDGFKSGLNELANSLAPVRPANENDPKSWSELWNSFKNLPNTFFNTYSNGSIEEKTRLTVSLLGVIRGKTPNSTGVVMAGMKSGRVIYFGRLALDRNYFHTVIKPQILEDAGRFRHVVGDNPDIKIVGGHIQLTGTGPYIGKSFNTTLKASDYLNNKK